MLGSTASLLSVRSTVFPGHDQSVTSLDCIDTTGRLENECTVQTVSFLAGECFVEKRHNQGLIDAC